MIEAVKALFQWLYGLLKVFDVSKYIDAIEEPLAEYMGWVNWLIPFGDLLAIYTAWLACIGGYFVFITVRPLVIGLIKKLFNGGG